MSQYEKSLEERNEELQTLLERGQLFQDMLEEDLVAFNHGNIITDYNVHHASGFNYPQEEIIKDVTKEIAEKLLENPLFKDNVYDLKKQIIRAIDAEIARINNE